MMEFKIKFDREACIGCGACTTVCDNWVLDDGKVKPKKIELDEVGCNQEVADICPVNAIKIEK